MFIMSRSIASYNLIKTLHLSKPIHRFQSLLLINPTPHFIQLPKHNSNLNYGFGFLGTRNFQYLTTIHRRPQSDCKSTRVNWIFGICVTIILPFFSSKWGPLLKWTKEVEATVETVEQIIDVVEEVAKKVDEVAEEISSDLSEGGTLKKVVDFIEDVAEEIAKDAKFAGDIIDKVQGVEDKLESLIDQEKEVAKEESDKKESK